MRLSWRRILRRIDTWVMGESQKSATNSGQPSISIPTDGGLANGHSDGRSEMGVRAIWRWRRSHHRLRQRSNSMRPTATAAAAAATIASVQRRFHVAATANTAVDAAAPHLLIMLLLRRILEYSGTWGREENRSERVVTNESEKEKKRFLSGKNFLLLENQNWFLDFSFFVKKIEIIELFCWNIV